METLIQCLKIYGILSFSLCVLTVALLTLRAYRLGRFDKDYVDPIEEEDREESVSLARGSNQPQFA